MAKELDLYQKDDTFDMIQKYYRNQAKLTEKQHEQLKRWQRAYALLDQEKVRSVAIRKYMSTFDPPLPQATAYYDFKKAEELFAPMEAYNKEFIRRTLIESALKDIAKAEKNMQKLIQKDEETGKKYVSQPRQWKMYFDAKDKAEKRLLKASGILDKEMEQFDWSRLEPHNYTINLPPEVLQTLTSLLASGEIDLSSIASKLAEEIDFEEMDEDEE